ncbi:MAG: hypothetical protein ACLQVD_04050, partial [Capsulimonadaceae bacterium]
MMVEVKTPERARRRPAVARDREKFESGQFRYAAPGGVRVTPARVVERALAQIPAVRPSPAEAPSTTRRKRVKAADRVAQSEARLLAILVTGTCIVCGLLIVYLAAYAQVATLGIQQSHARIALREKRAETEELRAACAAAASPALVASAAAQMGMLHGAERVTYVTIGGAPLE